MMAACTFEWEAPRITTPGHPIGIHRDGWKIVANERTARQKCCLPSGHGGVHRSLTNVVKEQEATSADRAMVNLGLPRG